MSEWLLIPGCTVCNGKRDVVLPGGVAVCRTCDVVDAFRRPPNMLPPPGRAQ